MRRAKSPGRLPSSPSPNAADGMGDGEYNDEEEDDEEEDEEEEAAEDGSDEVSTSHHMSRIVTPDGTGRACLQYCMVARSSPRICCFTTKFAHAPGATEAAPAHKSTTRSPPLEDGGEEEPPDDADADAAAAAAAAAAPADDAERMMDLTGARAAQEAGRAEGAAAQRPARCQPVRGEPTREAWLAQAAARMSP